MRSTFFAQSALVLSLALAAAAPVEVSAGQRDRDDRQERHDRHDRSDRHDRHDRHDRDDRRDGHRDQRGWNDRDYRSGYREGRRDERRWDRYDDRRDYRRDQRGRVVYRETYRAPVYHSGYGYAPPRWSRGHRINDYRWAPTYVVVDYGRYGLRHPPRGHHWRRDDRGDWLLVAIASGVIADVIFN